MRYTASNTSNVFVSFIFDDGKASVYDTVFPIFEDYGIVGNIAFVGSYLNKKGYLTSEQVKELLRNQWSLGDHTFTHPDMNSLSLSELSEEIEQNQALAKQILGYKFSHFIFPKSRVRLDHLPLILGRYCCAFTGSSQIISNRPPFRGLLNRTQISVYEMVRFLLEGRDFFKELIRNISSSMSYSIHERHWFVLFTHNVAPIPGIFDTPQHYFSRFIQDIIKMGVQIISVDSVLKSEK